MKKCQKMTEKKVVKSKNAFSKSCPKFYKLGDEFFYFDEISKLWILEPKNVFRHKVGQFYELQVLRKKIISLSKIAFLIRFL